MEEDVLELTNMVPDEEPEEEDPWPRKPDIDFESLLREEMEPPPPPPPPPRPRRLEPMGDDRLVSDHPASLATAAFSQLSNSLGGERFIGSMPISPGSRTVEDVIKELLRPLLREWLDEHLPRLVERLVQAELDKMVKRSRDY
jgi:cell pole-organizing protein PopZ